MKTIILLILLSGTLAALKPFVPWKHDTKAIVAFVLPPGKILH